MTISFKFTRILLSTHCLPALLLVCLSACPLACLSVCLPSCLSACLPACLSALLSVGLPFCPSLCLSACLSVSVSRLSLPLLSLISAELFQTVLLVQCTLFLPLQDSVLLLSSLAINACVRVFLPLQDTVFLVFLGY